jgi:hypothetical protein
MGKMHVLSLKGRMPVELERNDFPQVAFRRKREVDQIPQSVAGGQPKAGRWLAPRKDAPPAAPERFGELLASIARHGIARAMRDPTQLAQAAPVLVHQCNFRRAHGEDEPSMLPELRQATAKSRWHKTSELAEPPVEELADESEKTRKHGDTFEELQPMSRLTQLIFLLGNAKPGCHAD